MQIHQQIKHSWTGFSRRSKRFLKIIERSSSEKLLCLMIIIRAKHENIMFYSMIPLYFTKLYNFYGINGVTR